MIGDIKLFPADFAPQGWAACDGKNEFLTGLQRLLGRHNVKLIW